MEFSYLLFLFLLQSICSSNQVEGLRAEKIIGGITAHKNKFKYVVAVMYRAARNLPKENICMGAIIADKFIATIAFCFFNKTTGVLRNGEYSITAGLKDLMNPGNAAKNVLVELVIISKLYNSLDSDSYKSQGNLGILKLNSSLELRKGHPTLTKLQIRKKKINDYSRTLYVSGFGYYAVNLIAEIINGTEHIRQSGQIDGKLRYARGIPLADDDCFGKIGDIIAPGNMCVQLKRTQPDQPVGICEGDGGSPLAHHYYLDGLAISGFMPCNEEQKPGIYLDAAYYYEYITSILRGCRSPYVMDIYRTVVREGQLVFQRV